MVLTSCEMTRAASHLLSSVRVLMTLLQMRDFSSTTIIAWTAEHPIIKNLIIQSHQSDFVSMNLGYSSFDVSLMGSMRTPMRLKNSENIATRPSLKAKSKRWVMFWSLTRHSV